MKDKIAFALVLALLALNATASPGSRTRGVSRAKPSKVVDCDAKVPMRVHFYDVGQALAALVDLPDGRRVLVDTGEGPTRAGCGAVCQRAHAHLLDRLAADLGDQPITMLWITHQHSDHLGGAVDVLERFHVNVYTDNGRDPAKAQVKRARKAAQAGGATLAVVDPSHPGAPIPGSGSALRILPVVPREWPASCDKNANNCSIGLRVEYCSSIVLFMGDAEDGEEAVLDSVGKVTLLQLGHHGSDTSSSPDFVAKVAPRYAVISAGKKGEGLNRVYCHPRQVTVERLTAKLGGAGTGSILSFDGSVSCRSASDSHWAQVTASDRLWATPRDGDVTLMTKGDGVFVREPN